jgi:hypothetical protein
MLKFLLYRKFLLRPIILAQRARLALPLERETEARMPRGAWELPISPVPFAPGKQDHKVGFARA